MYCLPVAVSERSGYPGRRHARRALGLWVEENLAPPPNRRALDCLTVGELCPIVPQNNIVISNKHDWPKFYPAMPGLAQVWNRLCCLPPDNSAILHSTLAVRVHSSENLWAWTPTLQKSTFSTKCHPSIYIYGIPKVGLLTDNTYAYITVTTATIHTSTVMSFQMPLP